jgi:hypothetical protein
MKARSQEDDLHTGLGSPDEHEARLVSARIDLG